MRVMPRSFRKNALHISALLLAWLPLPSSMIAQMAPLNERELLTKAKASYYLVRSLGVKRFQCRATPSWKADNIIGSDPALLQQVEAIAYSVIVSLETPRPYVAVTVIRPNGSKADQRAEKAIESYRLIIQGDFEIWMTAGAELLFYDVANQQFSISRQPTTYLLSSKYGDLEMDLDYVIKKMTIPRPASPYVIFPRFSKVEGNRLLLTGLEMSGNGLAATQMSIEHEDAQGTKLPSKIVFGSARNQREVTFHEYHLN